MSWFTQESTVVPRSREQNWVLLSGKSLLERQDPIDQARLGIQSDPKGDSSKKKFNPGLLK